MKSPRTEAPQSMAEINRRLRQENAELRHTVKVARDSMAAMALRMARVVGEAERRIGAAERRSAHRTKAGQVAGQFTDERVASSNDKVVNMKTRKPVEVT